MGPYTKDNPKVCVHCLKTLTDVAIDEPCTVKLITTRDAVMLVLCGALFVNNLLILGGSKDKGVTIMSLLLCVACIVGVWAHWPRNPQ